MEVIPFGIGVYAVPQAARLLRVRSRTVTRWFRGYSYRPAPGAPRREKPPVGRTQRDLPPIKGRRDMSFLEFEELVVVTAFVRKGLSLQRIRAAADILMHEYGVDRPFAYQRIFTDGFDIFLSLSQEARAPDLIKLTHRERLQVRAGRIDEPFVEEIEFSPDEPHAAVSYHPLGAQIPIVLDPRVAFGAPVIEGTRVTTEAIAALVRGSSVEDASEAYGIPPETIRAAADYESSLQPIT